VVSSISVRESQQSSFRDLLAQKNDDGRVSLENPMSSTKNDGHPVVNPAEEMILVHGS